MKYILVVENELNGRKQLSDALGKSGYYVLFVQDTLNALKMLTERQPVAILMELLGSRPDNRILAKILKNDESTGDILVVGVGGTTNKISDANEFDHWIESDEMDKAGKIVKMIRGRMI